MKDYEILILAAALSLGLIPRASREYFAKTISGLFHPMLMTTYGTLLMFYGIRNTIFDYMTNTEVKWRISVIVFMFSFVFPVANIVVLYKLRRVKNISLSEQSERTFPYIMTSLFYFGLFYLLKDISIWRELKILILGGGVAILLCALINLKTKISAHMTGLGGLLGSLISLSYVTQFDMTLFYISVIMLAGLVGFARLYLKEHRPAQVYSGFALGLFVQTALFLTLEKTTFL
jgi:succinate dehydrogenase hydrophobic anchor subunit